MPSKATRPNSTRTTASLASQPMTMLPASLRSECMKVLLAQNVGGRAKDLETSGSAKPGPDYSDQLLELPNPQPRRDCEERAGADNQPDRDRHERCLRAVPQPAGENQRGGVR